MWIEGKPPVGRAVIVYDTNHDDISYGIVNAEYEEPFLEPLGVRICGVHEDIDCVVEYEDITHWIPVRRPEVPDA